MSTTRRDFLRDRRDRRRRRDRLAKGVAVPRSRIPNPAPLQLDEITIAQLQDGLQRDVFTSRMLVEAYIARINARNGALHAVIEINPDALTVADARDAERKRGKSPARSTASRC